MVMEFKVVAQKIEDKRREQLNSKLWDAFAVAEREGRPFTDTEFNRIKNEFNSKFKK